MNKEAEIAHMLLQIKAIKLSPQKPFTWSSGLLSPIYCDNRVTLSFPEVRNTIANAFKDLSGRFEKIDIIAGIATGGIPHGMLLADRLNLPFIYVRSKAKAHGRQNLIEGEIEAGQKVLVIEDLISTGGSSIRAVEALKEKGADVLAVAAIFSYGFEKARLAFEKIDCKYYTLSSYSALLTEAVRTGYIDPEEEIILKQWSQAPGKWGL